MEERLQVPFSDIVGSVSPIQKAIKLIWDIFNGAPTPDNGSSKSSLAAQTIILHLLGTINSIGMINMAGYHSAALTLLRSAEDALDCFCAVAKSADSAQKWLDGQLIASSAAKIWTTDKMTDDLTPLSEYRKNIRSGLNDYCHCTRCQTNWNLYRKGIPGDTRCTVELNFTHLVISTNAYHIDRYLCIHLFELIDAIQMFYTNYLLENPDTAETIKTLKKDIERIITEFLKGINTDRLYMNVPPELIGLTTVD